MCVPNLENAWKLAKWLLILDKVRIDYLCVDQPSPCPCGQGSNSALLGGSFLGQYFSECPSCEHTPMACPEITEDIKYIHNGSFINTIYIHSAVKEIGLTAFK